MTSTLEEIQSVLNGMIKDAFNCASNNRGYKTGAAYLAAGSAVSNALIGVDKELIASKGKNNDLAFLPEFLECQRNLLYKGFDEAVGGANSNRGYETGAICMKSAAALSSAIVNVEKHIRDLAKK